MFVISTLPANRLFEPTERACGNLLYPNDFCFCGHGHWDKDSSVLWGREVGINVTSGKTPNHLTAPEISFGG